MGKYNLTQLRAILEDTIMNNRTHKHYDRTVELASLYKKIMTGENQQELIVSYKPRETEDQKEQRINITNTRTKYVSNKIVSVFKRVPRSDVTIDNIYFDGIDDSQQVKIKVDEISASFTNFHKGLSMVDYLTEAFEHYSFYDPNAWMLIEINPDPKQEKKAKTYPVEIPSDQAINYEWTNHDLEFLIIKQGCDVVEKKEQKNTHPDRAESGKFKMDQRIQSAIDRHTMTSVRPGSKFILYAPDYAIEYFEVAVAEKSFTEVEEVTFAGYQFIDLKIGEQIRRFASKEYNTKSKVTPAKQFGFIKDPQTNRETFVGQLDPAIHIMKDLINTKSEYDLVKAVHGFLQKIQYADVCRFEELYEQNADRCLDGKLRVSGRTCPECKGLGLKVHRSVQDIILKKWPEDKDEFIPLREAIYYVEVPEHMVKMWKQEVADLERDVSFAIFNTNLFDRSEIAVTATEKRLNTDAAYDVLFDYGCQYSAFVKFVTTMTAIHTNNDDKLVVEHKITSFSLESTYDYLAQRKMAVESGSPYVVIQAIDMMCLSKQAQDSPINVEWLKAREKFRPFREKSKEETMYILAELPATDQKKVLYIYYEDVMDEIENDHKDFASMKYNAQRDLINEVVKQYIPKEQTILDPQPRKPGSPDIPAADEEDPTPGQIEAMKNDQQPPPPNAN